MSTDRATNKEWMAKLDAINGRVKVLVFIFIAIGLAVFAYGKISDSFAEQKRIDGIIATGTPKEAFAACLDKADGLIVRDRTAAVLECQMRYEVAK
jgi:hypothetical protein